MPTTPILKLPYPTPDDPPDGPAQIQALAEAIEGVGPAPSGLLIVGEVRFIAVAAAPAGWLLADGRAVSRATYAELFAAIGATYGAGDGSTTFNLPPVAGRALIGAGAGAGLTARAAGDRVGEEKHKLVKAELAIHDHTGATGFMSNSANRGTDGNVYQVASGAVYGLTSIGPIEHSHPVRADGGDVPHENMQPSLAIPAYIYAGA